MPGKPTQDWNDDGAFWNEAWTDMEQRLDGKSGRKKIAWWWALPVLLLLGGAAGALTYQAGSAEPATLPTTLITIDDPIAGDTRPEAGLPVPDAVLEEMAAIRSAETEGVIAKAENFRTELLTEIEPVHPEVPAAPGPLREHELITDYDGMRPVAEAGKKRSNTAIAGLGRELITQVHFRSPLPEQFFVFECKITPPPKVNYGVSVSGNLASGMDVPGYSAGIFATLRANKRISIPLSLRFRKDELTISDKESNDSSQDLASTPTPGGQLFDFNFSSNESFAGRRLDRLTVSGIELETGISVRVSRKFRMNILAGGEYLLGARGVTDLALQDGVLNASYTGIAAGENEFAALEDLLTLNNMGASFLNTSANRNLGSPRDSGLYRWQFRGSLSGEYAIGNRLSLTANYSSLLTPVFTGDLLRVRPSQFGLGLKYRLR